MSGGCSPWMNSSRLGGIESSSVTTCRASLYTICHTCHTVFVSRQKLSVTSARGQGWLNMPLIRIELCDFKSYRSGVSCILYISELVDQQGTPSHWPVQE